MSKKWDEMVANSKAAKEDFNEFADDNAIIWAAQELEQANKRIEALEAMLSKKLDLIRCGIGGNYSGYPKENPLYIEVVELLSNGG